MRWGSGGGIDLILLHALPFWFICGLLQSWLLARVSFLTPSPANHVPASYVDCISAISFGGTMEAAVTFGILVHFSLPAELMRQPGEH